MKKILFFVDSFPNYSETFIHNQIYYLIDQSFDVEILAIKEKNYSQKIVHQKMIDYTLDSKVKFLRHGINLDMLINFIFSPMFSLRLIRNFPFKKSLFLIQNFDVFNFYRNFDLIHAHYGHVGALVADLRSVGIFKNQRLICSFHGEELLPVYLTSYQRKYTNLVKLFDVITVNSIYTKELIFNTLMGTENIIKILPVSLDVNSFRPFKSSINKNEFFFILFVGRLINWKAPLLAIQIVERLLKKKYKIKLDIIGSGTEYDKCKNYIFNHNLFSSITLHGALSQEKIKEYFNNADVFLYPGIRDPLTFKAEAQGLVIQEAQAMELPVVVSNVGGIRYGMIEGETGFVLDEMDLEGFEEKIVYLMHNPEIRTQMGKKGREYVSREFDMQVLGNRLVEIYDLT
jgi:colanic acid/amylovoran biosynthesis glycosyltransferase